MAGAIRYEGHAVIYPIKPQQELICCPKCASQDVSTRGYVNRTLRGVPVGSRKDIMLEVDIPKVYCPECEFIRQIDIKIADPQKSYTKALAEEVIKLYSRMTVKDTAEYLGLSWSTAGRILINELQNRYSNPDEKALKNLTMIAIDEISVASGHKYLTVVLNLETGKPVFVGEGKSEHALDPLWKTLGPRRMSRIEVVAIDMGPAFIKAVRVNLPGARIVFDRFHVIKLMNTKLDVLRRRIFSEATKEHKDILARSKYLLLKNEENLDPTKNERERLDRLLALNSPLTLAYRLKESLRQLWTKENYGEGSANLYGWIALARETKIPELVSMAKTLEKHAEGILNYYHCRVSSGPLEGLNNKIRVLTRRAYGFRNIYHLTLHILAIKEFDPRELYRIRYSEAA
jgi:transposase